LFTQYLINSKLIKEEYQAAFLLSVFWFSFTLGRFLFVFFSGYFNLKYIIIFLFLLSSFSIFLLLQVKLINHLIISTALFGFGISSLFACIFIYPTSNLDVKISGLYNGILTALTSVGKLFNY
jgi:MFS family permease